MNADAHRRLGIDLYSQHDTAAAIDCFDQALELEPNWPKARLERALARLAGGEWGTAWDDYECRLKVWDAVAPDSRFRWEMPQSHGKPVVVWGEQGVGLQVMFASCLPDVLRDTNHCIVVCEPRLAPLLRRSFAEAEVIAGDQANADTAIRSVSADTRQIPLGSLPRLYRRSESDFPAEAAYLVPDPLLCRKWASRLNALGDGLKVGISWRGGADVESERRRSTRLADWSRLFSLPGIEWINVQHGQTDTELAEAKSRWDVTIHDWDDLDQREHVDDLAALASSLDLVISVGNSTVHLAGAVGTPVWSLVAHSTDWRWLLDRDDSPWHRTVRLFRQPSPSCWTPVFERLRRHLMGLAMTGKRADGWPRAA